MKIKLYPKELLEAAWKQDKKLYAHGDAAAPPKCLRCRPYAPAPRGMGCRQVWTPEEKSGKVHLLSGAELHFFRSVQAHLQASNAAHRTPRQRTCLFPFGLRWIPLVDNLAQ